MAPSNTKNLAGGVRRALVMVSIFSILIGIACRIALIGDRSSVEIGMVTLPFFIGLTAYELRISNGRGAAGFIVFSGSIVGAICFSCPSVVATLNGDIITNGFLVGNGWDFVLIGAFVGAAIGIAVSPASLFCLLLYVLARRRALSSRIPRK